MTDFSAQIAYSVKDASKAPTINVASFRGFVLQFVLETCASTTDGLAGLVDIGEHAASYVWDDGKLRSEKDLTRLIQDILHAVGDTTKNASGWLEKHGGRRIGTGTGGRGMGGRKYDPVVLPVGCYVFVSKTANVEDAKLVDSRPLEAESELRYKVPDMGDILPAFTSWLSGLRGANAKVKESVFLASMSMADKDRKSAILAWHRDGRSIAAVRTAFTII